MNKFNELVAMLDNTSDASTKEEIVEQMLGDMIDNLEALHPADDADELVAAFASNDLETFLKTLFGEEDLDIYATGLLDFIDELDEDEDLDD